MNKIYLVKMGSLLCAAGALLAAGCSVGVEGPGGGAYASTTPGEIYVDGAPPPLIDEPVPVEPGPGYVWIGGNWDWDGGRWRWDHGRWDRPPERGMHWEPHHYAYARGHHVFRLGGWRR